MIRVGLVGTNTSHANAFAGLLNGVDGKPPQVGGAKVVSVWGSDSPGLGGRLTPGSEIAEQFGIDTVVDSPADMLGSIDAVLVVDDVDGGGLHGTLARPFLEAGLPTYIDKPMTLEVSEAVELFDLAEQHNAPLLSVSALRFARELPDITDQDLGKLSSVVSVGPGSWYNYGVHAVEVAVAIVGSGATWLHRHAFADRDVAVIGYDEGPSVVIETLRDAAYNFHAIAYGASGFAQAHIADFDGFYGGTMEAVVQMVQTGTSPVTRQETLEVLAILTAGERSKETGGPVAIADVLAGK